MGYYWNITLVGYYGILWDIMDVISQLSYQLWDFFLCQNLWGQTGRIHIIQRQFSSSPMYWAIDRCLLSVFGK